METDAAIETELLNIMEPIINRCGAYCKDFKSLALAFNGV